MAIYDEFRPNLSCVIITWENTALENKEVQAVTYFFEVIKGFYLVFCSRSISFFKTFTCSKRSSLFLNIFNFPAKIPLHHAPYPSG
jgi:hypothetical protein